MTLTPAPAPEEYPEPDIADPEPMTTLTLTEVQDLAAILDKIDGFLRDGGGSAAVTGYWAECGHPRPGYAAGLLIDEVSFTSAWLHNKATRATQEETNDDE